MRMAAGKGDLGRCDRSAVNKLFLAPFHDSPTNKLRAVEGPQAVLLRTLTTLAHIIFEVQVPACNGNEKAIPGYDRT